MEKLLQDKVVVITGGSRGIGRATALACASHGAHVLINHAADPPGVSGGAPAQEVVDMITAMGRRALALEGDIADPATSTALVAAAVEHFGGLDVAVANAGICQFHAFLDLPVDLLRRHIAVNLEGTFHLAQAAGRQMQAQGRGGAIIAISSISKLVGGEFQSHYTPTKAGQHALMQSCACTMS